MDKQDRLSFETYLDNNEPAKAAALFKARSHKFAKKAEVFKGDKEAEAAADKILLTISGHMPEPLR